MKHRLLIAASMILVGLGLCAQEMSLLDKARAAYEKRADVAQAKEAMALYKQAAQADPKSYDALWEGARSCYYYGNYARSEAPDSEKLPIFQDGIDRAKAAIALKADGAEGHFWLGVLDGVYGEAKGILKSLHMVPEIKAEMAECQKLDNTVECYGPDRVLGRLYYKLPWFKGGDNKMAIEFLEKAVKGCPTNALSKLYLAETLKSEGEKDRAIALVKEIIAMTPDPRWAPEHANIKATAEKFLKKWS